jgi:hypothetical protein
MPRSSDGSQLGAESQGDQESSLAGGDPIGV